MRGIAVETNGAVSSGTPMTRAAELLAQFFAGQNHLRKGICLLNAGQFDSAAAELKYAAALNPDSRSLPRYLISALVGSERLDEASEQAAAEAWLHPEDVAGLIQLALLQWKRGKIDDAIQTLREAIADHTDNAELHFQLGTLLAARDDSEEAELRFTQALSIDKTHTDAQVSLAMCWGAKGDASGALRHLQAAQRIRPSDVRIATLLNWAAKAARDAGHAQNVRAVMPQADILSDEGGIEELSRLIEREPDFAESFLNINQADVDETAYAMLAATIKRALERNPHRANLYYMNGQVLDRLGRSEEAIFQAERAVDLDPRYIKALILLAKLYQKTDRWMDAADRLEETVRLGAEYADTYFLLGNLYRDSGQVDRARWAYEHALKINGHYEDARKALDALAA
jgi:tetratricopeptide (TPR) repeat protein